VVIGGGAGSAVVGFAVASTDFAVGSYVGGCVKGIEVGLYELGVNVGGGVFFPCAFRRVVGEKK
jgi:hypothetical protein